MSKVTVVYYPEGHTKLSDGSMVSNVDLARETVEAIMNAAGNDQDIGLVLNERWRLTKLEVESGSEVEAYAMKLTEDISI